MKWKKRQGVVSFCLFLFFFAGFFSRFVLFFFKKKKVPRFHHSTVRKSKEPEKTKTNENRKVMGRLFGDAVLGRPPWERMDSLYNLFFFLPNLHNGASSITGPFNLRNGLVAGHWPIREQGGGSTVAICILPEATTSLPTTVRGNPVKPSKTR